MFCAHTRPRLISGESIQDHWSCGFNIMLLGCLCACVQYEPCCKKTGLKGFQPGPTQTRLYSHRK